MSKIALDFEAGVADYFRDFGHRLARETVHQSWLLISVSKYISSQLLVGELQVPNQDLKPFGELRDTQGAVNFDFAVTRSEIDLRSWKAKTEGWKKGASTAEETLLTLRETDVLAEFKIANSTSTDKKSLAQDIRRLSCAIRFIESKGCDRFPECYYIVLDPQARLAIDEVMDTVKPEWPDVAPFPKLLVGP